MATKSLTFELFGKDKSASRTMEKVGKSASTSAEKFKKFGAVAAIGLAAVGAAAVKFGADSIEAYAEAEESQKRLAFAFEKFPKLADSSQKALQNLNSEWQKKTRFDDDNIASGQAILAQFNLTGKQLENVTPLLLDYASATGKDIPAAATDVGKALLGNAKALKNIGIKYTATGDAATDFANVTQLMADKIGGFAEKEGTTAAGKLDILKNQFGEIMEKVGEKLIPVLSTLADVTSTKVLPALSDLGDSKGIDDFFAAIDRHSKSGDVLGFMDPAAWGNGLQQIKNFMNNGEVNPTGTGGPLDPAAWSNGFAQIAAVMGNGLAQWDAKLRTGWGQISTWFLNGVAEWGAKLGNGLDQITAWWNSSVAQWSGALSNGWNQIAGFFSRINVAITSWVAGLTGDAFNAGTSIVRGIANGIGSAIGSVSSAMGDVMATIASFLPHSPAKQGPFSGSGWTALKTSGEALMGQFTSGFDAGPGVGAAMANAISIPSVAAPGVGSATFGSSGSGVQPIYVQNPFTGEYLLSKVDGRAAAVTVAADRANVRVGVQQYAGE